MKYLTRLFARDVGALVTLCAIALLVRLAFFSGYQGQDDRIYIFYAEHFAATGHPPEVNSNWIGRIGGWVPVAASIRLTGTSDLSMATWSLLCSLGLVVVVYLIGKMLLDRPTALLAALFAACFPLETIYASTAYVDVPVGFFQTLALYLFLRQYHIAPGYRYALLAGVALGCGYLCRETAVFSLAPFGLIALSRGNLLKRIGIFCAGFGVVIAVELAFWSLETGDALYRVHAIQARASHLHATLSDDNDPKVRVSLIPGPRPTERYRAKNTFTDAALMFMVNEEFVLYYFVVFPALVLLTLNRDAPTRDLRIYFGVLLVLCLFFPLQYFKFTVPRDPRYYVCLTGPAVLCLARWMQSLNSGWLRRSAIAGLILSGFAGLAITSQSRENGAKRLLSEFQKQHAAETLWCSPDHAAMLAYYSGFADRPNVNIHFLSGGAQSNRFQNYQLYRPDVVTAERPEQIDHGYVALSSTAHVTIPVSWHEVARLNSPLSSITNGTICAFRLIGLPPSWKQRLLPGNGEAITVYHMDKPREPVP